MENEIIEFSAYEIAMHICKIDITSDDYDVEETLQQMFGIDIEQLKTLLEALLPLIQLATNPLSNEVHIGFSKPGVWLMKKSFESEFIDVIIQWMTAGQPFTPSKLGVQRTITDNTNPAYEIKLQKIDNN